MILNRLILLLMIPAILFGCGKNSSHTEPIKNDPPVVDRSTIPDFKIDHGLIDPSTGDYRPGETRYAGERAQSGDFIRLDNNIYVNWGFSLKPGVTLFSPFPTKKIIRTSQNFIGSVINIEGDAVVIDNIRFILNSGYCVFSVNDTSNLILNDIDILISSANLKSESYQGVFCDGAGDTDRFLKSNFSVSYF